MYVHMCIGYIHVASLPDDIIILSLHVDVHHSTTTLGKRSNHGYHGCYNLTVFQVKMTSSMCWRGLWIWLPLGSHWDRL